MDCSLCLSRNSRRYPWAGLTTTAFQIPISSSSWFALCRTECISLKETSNVLICDVCRYSQRCSVWRSAVIRVSSLVPESLELSMFGTSSLHLLDALSINRSVDHVMVMIVNIRAVGNVILRVIVTLRVISAELLFLCCKLWRVITGSVGSQSQRYVSRVRTPWRVNCVWFQWRSVDSVQHGNRSGLHSTAHDISSGSLYTSLFFCCSSVLSVHFIALCRLNRSSFGFNLQFSALCCRKSFLKFSLHFTAAFNLHSGLVYNSVLSAALNLLLGTIYTSVLTAVVNILYN